MSKAIFKMNFSAGRMGDLSGIFIAEKNHVEILVNRKIQVYFGEVLGKHSEIYGTIDENEIKIVSDSPADIEVFERLDLSNGYNPFDYEPYDYSDDSEGLSIMQLVLKLESEAKEE